MKLMEFVVVDGLHISICNYVLFVVQEVTKSKNVAVMGIKQRHLLQRAATVMFSK
jgi:hypothetical protein